LRFRLATGKPGEETADMAIADDNDAAPTYEQVNGERSPSVLSGFSEFGFGTLDLEFRPGG